MEDLDMATAEQTSEAVDDITEDNLDFSNLFEADQPENEGEVEQTDQTAEAEPEEESGSNNEDNADSDGADQTYVLKHLDEEKAVTLSEMQELAQKGLDYGRIRERYDQAKPQLETLQRLAKEAGVTPVDYLNQVVETVKANSIAARADQLIRENYLDENAAYEVAKTEYENNQLANKVRDFEEEKRLQNSQAEEQQQRQAVFNADLDTLIKMRPELLQAKSLPQEVIMRIEKDGVMPTVAYLDWEIKQKDVMLQQLKQTVKNEAKNPGSIKGEFKPDTDPFLSGLESDI